MNNAGVSLVLGLAIMLSGCVSGTKFSLADRSRIKSVVVNPKTVRGELLYTSQSQALALGISGALGGAVGGAVGGAIAGNSSQTPAQMKSDFMESHAIRIEEIVQSEFTRQLKARKLIPVADSHGDAEITLAVSYFALGVPNGFSSALRPGVGVMASMKDKTGKEMWKKWAAVTPVNPSLPKHPWAEYEATPGLLKEAYEMAAKLVVQEILDDLAKS